jgi:hypothetical protein
VSNIIDFQTRAPARRLPEKNEDTADIEFPPTKRQIASSQRNPLRKSCHAVDLAVTIAGRLQRNEAMPSLDVGLRLQEGLDAARLLADKLEGIMIERKIQRMVREIMMETDG